MCGNNTPTKSQRLPKKAANGQVPKWNENQRAWIASDEAGSGVNAYLYIAYADDANGNGFTTTFDPSKTFIAIKHTTNIMSPIQAEFAGLWFNYKGIKGDPGSNGNNGNDGFDGKDGQSAFVYIGYADDDAGNGFSPFFDSNKRYIAIRHTNWVCDEQDPETFAGYWVRYKGNDGANGQNGTDGVNGQNAYVYIGYADDAGGNGFSPFFNASKNYIAIRPSTIALANIQPTFNGLWFNYKGQQGNPGIAGNNGQNAYVYIAYADNNTGTGFTTAFNPTKNYVAIKSSTVPLTPVQGDFAGLWFNYKGQAGANGINGSNGANGQNAYLYIGYADTENGDGYTQNFDPSKAYIAIYQTIVPIDVSQSTFDGIWTRYKGIDASAFSQEKIERISIDSQYYLTPANGKVYLIESIQDSLSVILQAPIETLRCQFKNSSPLAGEARIYINSDDGTISRMLSPGYSLDLIYDAATGVWEVITF